MRISLGVLLAPALAVQAQQAPVWEFPNFSDRVQVAVSNARDTAFDGVAVLSLASLRGVQPSFPGTLLVAAESTTPARQIETQLDAGRGEFVMEVHVGPHETRMYSIYTSSTLQDTFPQTVRVYASHNYGYNHATAAIESEGMGYRSYGGFFLDVQAHAKGEHGLFNTAFGYASIRHPLAEGQDVIHLGDTLGLGGIFLRAGAEVFRPPVSTPEYTHRMPKAEEPQYRVLESGPIRAIIEESLPVWTIGKDSVALRAEYEMDAGQDVVHCRWWIRPIKLSHAYEVGAGIRDLDTGKSKTSGRITTTEGAQPDSDGRIALGIRWGDDADSAGVLKTADGGNETVVFHEKLRPGRSIEGAYTVAAGWQGSGWEDPAAHVAEILTQQSEGVSVKIVRHETNPNPKALDEEPK